MALVPLLKKVPVAKAIAHAGMDVQLALGRPTSQGAKSHWDLVTPINDANAALDACRFFRSISEQVDDDEKRGAFAMLVSALARAAVVANYQEVLKGSNTDVKVAHTFKYLNSVQKVWELKANKKDRLYFFSMTIKQGAIERHVIVLLLAHHKKDQTTPKDVAKYCENAIRTYLDPQVQIEVKE